MSSQQQLEVPRVIEAFEKNNKYYLKTFLLDDSIARNGMGVNPEYVPKHIHKFVGKPVILTPSFYHPHEFEHYKETGEANKDLIEYQKLQEPYEVGTIIDISTNSNLQQAGNTNYSALLEITDPKAISAFRSGKVPLYVSPSIYRVNSKDPIHSITDYEALHLAIVDNPAYGFHKANIKASCEGDKTECGRMLAQAGVFCVEKKLGDLHNIFQGSIDSNKNSSFTNLVHQENVDSMSDNQNASQSIPQQEQQEQAPVEQPKTPINTPTSVLGTTPQPEQQKEEVAQSPQQPQQQEQANEPVKAEQESKQENAEEETPCVKAQREYESKLVELENEIKLNKEFRENFVKTQEETKLKSKRARIESVVPANYASSEEERKKAVESLVNIPDEQLETILNSFVIPAARNIRQGGIVRRAKVTDFVQNNTNNVAQGSVPKVTSNDIREMERILSFGSSIVPKKNNSGGIA